MKPGDVPEVAALYVERFWGRVDKESGKPCWIWANYRDPHNYGKMGIGPRMFLAHRLSWAIENGPLPPGVWVLHHCDNPPCVNPAHLYVGDMQDNMDDMIRRGRRPVQTGESAPRCILTEAAVREIRSRYASGGETQVALGAEFGVSGGAIASVVNRRSWRHI